MTKRIRMRTLAFGGIITLLFAILISRIYYVQVVEGAAWYDMAKSRWAAQEVLPAKRGTIMDRNGNVLAMDSIAYNVAVNPNQINSLNIEDEIVEGLHDILGRSKEELYKLVTAKNDKNVFYNQREMRQGGWGIDKSLADQIKQLRNELSKEKEVSDVGIYLMEDYKRYYPRDTFASQLVGYLEREEGKAITGVEYDYNEQLRGEPGYIKYEKDGKRVQLATGEVEVKAAQDGKDIYLTIDNDIQHYAEEALREIGEKYEPLSATIIAADPQTMEILAMANIPEYNPNEYWESSYGNYYNHAIKSLYEPGSTFKIITLAAAVNEGVFDPDEMYTSGSIKYDNVPTIRDVKREGWGTISFLEGLKHSSNVAFVKLGYEKLGGSKLRQYISDFGFGQKTGIELSNESAGSINIQWPSDVARASFGQGAVTVTPIQQVAAVAAVANGGRLLRPQIVKQTYDPVTETKTEVEPELIREVITEESSRLVGQYLEQVVNDLVDGSGRNAYIEGYRVAGKTGTAQKVVDGEYSDSKYVVSFIGYAPVDDPKIVVFVLVDEPNNSRVGGGAVAAPAFKQIVAKSLRKMGVAPNWTTTTDSQSKEASVQAPDLTDQKIGRAKVELEAKALSYEVIGNGDTVLQQIPAAGAAIHPTQRIYLISEHQDKLAIPDLTGVSLRDALEITSLLGIRLIPEGQGYIISQKVEDQDGKRVLRVVLAPPIPPEDNEGMLEENSEETTEEVQSVDN